MEFHVLGSLAVTCGGRPLAIGGARTRTVLTILLINANSVVSADRIADELWPDLAPDRAANNLQVRLSELRKAFRSVGEGDRLVAPSARSTCCARRRGSWTPCISRSSSTRDGRHLQPATPRSPGSDCPTRWVYARTLRWPVWETLRLCGCRGCPVGGGASRCARIAARRAARWRQGHGN